MNRELFRKILAGLVLVLVVALWWVGSNTDFTRKKTPAPAPAPEDMSFPRPDESVFRGIFTDAAFPQPDWSQKLSKQIELNLEGLPEPRELDRGNMILIEAGQAVLGGTCQTAVGDNAPDRVKEKRFVPAFWIDRLPATWSEYHQCIEAQACPYTWTKSPGFQPQPDHPALVTYHEARSYCHWLGKRLPTEDEWEKAARGTDGRWYPWGAEPAPDATHGNFCDRNCTFDWSDADFDDGFAMTSPVGSFPLNASPYGLLDMLGNVKQWVLRPANEDLPEGGYIARGTSWYCCRAQLNVCNRHLWVPGVRSDDKGVRCAADPR